jgi:benzoyl-CoA reductase/2-hydroxyglutaryl-CoA dehydratase subunit BcrC/BadD/HgdB
MLNSIIEEVKKRKPAADKKPRLMVVGAQVDDAAFIKIVEDAGASVVIDDLCPGTRELWADTPVTADPIDGIATPSALKYPL